jgi:hypothetical protein
MFKKVAIEIMIALSPLHNSIIYSRSFSFFPDVREYFVFHYFNILI